MQQKWISKSIASLWCGVPLRDKHNGLQFMITIQLQDNICYGPCSFFFLTNHAFANRPPFGSTPCLDHILVSNRHSRRWCTSTHTSTPARPCHHGQSYTGWAVITSGWHTQRGRCLQVNKVQILAQLTSKLGHADNKADPGECPPSFLQRGWPGITGGLIAALVWSGFWQRTAPAASSPVHRPLAICRDWPVNSDRGGIRLLGFK